MLELIHFAPLVIDPANYRTVSVLPSLPTPDPAPRHRPAFLLHLASFGTTTLSADLVVVNLDVSFVSHWFIVIPSALSLKTRAHLYKLSQSESLNFWTLEVPSSLQATVKYSGLISYIYHL